MPIYSVGLRDCGCTNKCIAYQVVIEDNSSQLIVGNVYSFSGYVSFGCYVVDSFNLTKPGATPDTIIVNSYGPEKSTGCDDCVSQIYDYLQFTSCDGIIGEIIIPKNQFSPVPSIGDVLFIEIYFSNDSGLQQYSSCFELKSFTSRVPNFEVLVTSYSSHTDCKTCIDNSPLVYRIIECLSSTEYYIPLPSSGLDNHLITFTDLAGITQYCGVVIELSSGVINGTYVNDLGINNDGVDCDYCNGLVSEKKKLINCLNNSEEIVWASVLFQPGDSTHLSLGNGCYEISTDVVPPTSAITISELANYDPQQNCEDCLECYGLVYDFVSCEQYEICGPINIIDYFSLSGLSISRYFKIDSNDFAFIPFVDNNLIAKIDTNTSSVIEISNNVLNNPYSLDIDETNGVIAVTNYSNVIPSVFDITFFDYNDLSLSNNLSVTGVQPTKVYYNTNDQLFYFASAHLGGVINAILVYSGTAYNNMTFVTDFGTTNSSYLDIIQIGSFFYTLTSTNIEVYDTSYTLVNTYTFSDTLLSLTYDGGNFIYISTTNNYYVKFDLSLSGTTTHSFPYCSSSQYGIKVNSSTNRLYISDNGCNQIYEFDTLTDNLLITYSSELSNIGITQPFDIQADTLGNLWFGSFSALFQLGCYNDFISGQTTSNEYLSTGTTFFNYNLNGCCEITNITSITRPEFLNITEYLSMLHYSDCQTCTGTTRDIFYCTECVSGIGGILIAPQGTYSAGEFVRSQFGNSDWLCFEIIEPFSGQSASISFVSSGSSFTTCEECTSNATLGLTLINCNTLEASQVTVTLNDWIEITGFLFQLPNPTITDTNGVCYQVVNSCPIDNVHPLFEPQNFYLNQLFCRTANRPVPPISAGTEYFGCNICCPCDSGGTITQIVLPHPQWTNGQGRLIYLLDAITLGGPNGLNM